MTLRLLLVEDDPNTREYVAHGFAELGWTVERLDHGGDGLHMALTSTFDLIVLDRNLPGLDGLSMLKALRAKAIQTPVVILSAISHVDERVKGLRAGSDDYVVKPFHFSELLARAETVLKRKAPDAVKETLSYADIVMNIPARRVMRSGRELELLPREFKLMEYFLRHAGHVVTRGMLLEGVWDYSNSPHDGIVEKHISRLRKKLDEGFALPLLHTIRGVGYRLSDTP